MSEHYMSDSSEEFEKNPTFYFWLELGDDTDCETCGYSNNEAALTISAKEFEFIYHVGCTGGDSIYGSQENVKENLEDMFKHLRTFPNWNQHFEDKISSEITAWLKDNGK